MDTVAVEAVLWRFINLSNFKAVYDLNESDSGKSQVDIRLSGKQDVLDFFEIESNEDDTPSYSIDVIGVTDIPASTDSIEITTNAGRDEWRIPKQYDSEKKYELWKPTYGFPGPDDITWERKTAYYDEAPPLIYFVRDVEGRFYTRALPDTRTATLENYPEQLASPWAQSREARRHSNFGVVDLATSSEAEGQA